MKWGFTTLLVFINLFLFGSEKNTSIHYNSSHQDNSISESEINSTTLKRILLNTSKYCERIKQMAFEFYCQENIDETIHTFNRRNNCLDVWFSPLPVFYTDLKVRKKRRNSYTYDYQMIRQLEEKENVDKIYIHEQRILIGKNGKKTRRIKNMDLLAQRMQPKYLVFGPVGFFSRYWQYFFKYELTSLEYFKGKKVYVVEFFPLKEMDDNYYRGKALINAADLSVLKIECTPIKPIEFDDSKLAPWGSLKRIASFGVEYGTAKNGVMFPSTSYFVEKYVGLDNVTYLKSITNFNYTNYRYFIVGARLYNENIKKHVEVKEEFQFFEDL